MSYPKIALIGRPNVGKSSLFNRLLKERVSIVNEEEGVTRDRLYGEIEFEGSRFTIVDTAGLVNSDDFMKKEMVEQSLYAVQEADLCFFIVDAQVGVTISDEEVAKIVKRAGKPTILVVNKVDNEKHEELVHSFYSLGFSDMAMISSAHDLGIYELLETAARLLKDCRGEEEESEKGPCVGIVGRTNVGKSTLLNALSRQKRSIVSSEAATTRDMVRARIEHASEFYDFIDTAGLRRKHKENNAIEKFASLRTFQAIEQSDICLLVIDAKEGMRSQEKKLLTEIFEMGKACIVLLNKWDLVEDFRMEHVRTALIAECPHLEHYPMLFISAMTGRNLDKIYSLIDQIHEMQKKKLDTSEVNSFFENVIRVQHPPLVQGKRFRIYYATQLKTAPPTFMLFVNQPRYLTPNYRSFLINQMREHFKYIGTPIHFLLKGKTERKKAS